MRQRRTPRGATAVLLVLVALGSIAVGGAVIARAASGPASASSPTTTVANPVAGALSPRQATPVLQAAPIIIPPAPSTTSTTAATAPPPAPTEMPSVTTAARGTGIPVAWRRYIAPATPSSRNASATDITDPSVAATVLVTRLPLYTSPGAAQPSSSLANPNYLGATDVLLVTGYEPGWIQGYLPVRPNEATAWFPAADVSVSLVAEHLVVHLGARTITLYRDNVPVVTYPVAPGAPDSPTPTGSFFVAFVVKVTDPGSAYGPYALGTSDFSGTYQTFEGGPGQIGIHGTDQPWVIGTYASHGCIRLFDNDIAALAPQIVPGTPVEVEN
ncbi:MAG: L,D-transpeptidase [Acidimicrobiales bacterium]